MRYSTKQAVRCFNHLVTGPGLAAVSVVICAALLIFSLNRLIVPALANVQQVDLTCDVPITANISSNNETDSYRFAAANGERVEISVIRTTPSGNNFTPNWRLVTSNGNPAGSCGSFTTNSQADCGLLSAAASPYRIEVQDLNQNDTGRYILHLYRLPAATACENTALNCGVPVTGRIEPELDSDFYNFNVVDRETVRVNVARTNPFDPDFRPRWRLLRNDGLPASGCGSFTTNTQDNCGGLLASFNPYRVEIQDLNRDDVGSYTVSINAAVGPCPQPSIALTSSPLAVVAGTSENLVVTLGQTRNAATTIDLSSANTAIATVPATVTVPAATASASFPVTGVSVGGPVVITATLPAGLGGGTAKADVNVTAPTLSVAACSGPILQGSSCNMTATINPKLGIEVTLALSSSDTAIAAVADSVKIPAGEQSVTFPVKGVGVGGPVTITTELPAALGGGKATAQVAVVAGSRTADIAINPPNPTTDDSISIKLSGVWPDGCSPRDPKLTIVGSEIRIATSNPGDICTAVLTPWEQSVDVGKLAAGDYLVLASFTTNQGRAFELGRKTLKVATSPLITRILRVVDTNTNPGATVGVPITLDSQGDENALGFSLRFETSNLSNPQVTLGSAASGALLTVNSNQVADGRIGILIALPAGQKFNQGVRQIVVVSFVVASNTVATSTMISPVDQPISIQASDVNANSLAVSSASGVVTISRGLEADVAPRPNGDERLTIADCVQAGRFVAGLDTPSTGVGGEFQRADSAPRDSRGDGRLAVTDWVQACRYSAALDATQPVGGPASPASTLTGETTAGVTSAGAAAAQARIVRATSAGAEGGEIGALSISLNAQGDENAIGFSLRFDPSTWQFVSATTGNDARDSMLNINTKYALNGHIGIVLSLPAGQTFAAGSRELVRFKLTPITTVTDRSMAIAFDDYPAVREVADKQANPLSVDYLGVGTLRTISVVSAASFSRGAQAAESIATGFGVDLATATQVAGSSPLPTELAGTTVKVRDSTGTERAAPLFFVSPAQLNYQVPVGTALGIANVIVSRHDGNVAVGTTEITRVLPGLFTANASGAGLPAALVLRVKADGASFYEPVARFDPAANKVVAVPIDFGDETDKVYLIFFGTGFRSHGSLDEVKIKVGGVDLPVLFAGAQGDLVGLDQLNCGLLRSLAGRGELNVELTVEGKAANLVHIAIR